MSFKLTDLPPKARAQVEARLAEGEGRPALPAASGARPRRVAGCTWRCATCGEPFVHWTKAEGHADATKHRRIEVVLIEQHRSTGAKPRP